MLRASAARLLHAKISRAIPRASAATRVRGSSGRSAAVDVTVVAIAVVGARMAAVAVLTAVAAVPTVVVDAPEADHVSNAAQVAPGMTVAIKAAAPAPRAVRSSFPKC